ncbi:MAG: DMT family transporter [Bacteroidota bacterium]|jgi:drug/metabolite transporter (DMT)-like permease
MTLYLVMLLQQLIASSTHLIAKDAASQLHPISVVLVRGMWTCLAFGIWFALRRGTWKPVDRRDLRLIILLGIVNLPINQLLFIWGVSYTTPPNASLAYALTPAFVVALMIIVHRRSMSWKKMLGVVVALVGASIVLVDRGAGISDGQTLGNVMVLLASLSWAVFTLYGQRIVERYGPVQAIAMTFFSGLLAFVPVWILMPVDAQISVLAVPSSASLWWQLFYLGVITSGIGYGLWYYALSRLDSGKVAVFNNLQPVLTSLLTLIVLGTAPTTLFLIGGSVALVGVIITQRS